MRIVDLAAGSGGMLLGFDMAGDDPLAAFEVNPIHEMAIRNNLPFTTLFTTYDVPPSKIPHPDVVCAAIREPVKFEKLALALNPRILVFEGLSRMDFLGRDMFRAYRFHATILRAQDFGLPMNARRHVAIGLRGDVRTLFKAFPWPEPSRSRSLASVLENASTGNGLCPSMASFLTEADFMVEGSDGPRTLTLTETKRITGYPDGYFDVRNRSLWRAALPPMIRGVAEEIRTWLY